MSDLSLNLIGGRMELTLALLADYANVSQEGKLNVLGVFDTIFAPEFPAFHTELQLVLRFEAGPAERGQIKSIEIKLIDQDGNTLGTLSGKLSLPEESPMLVMGVNQILRFQHLVFERQGDYRFDVLVNGEPKGRGVRFRVEQQKPPEGGTVEPG